MKIWQPSDGSGTRPNRRALPRGTEPDHYHIIYGGIPRYRVGYPTQRDAYAELRRLGLASEPHTEWYDDGRVGIETRIHGRTGLHWVELEVAGCVRRACAPSRMATVPGTPVVELLNLED